MALGVNKAILIGFVGQEPKVSYTANGQGVANFSLATSESWKDKTSGEKKTETTWHRIVFWGPLVEVIKTYVAKGSKLYIEGKIKKRKYTDEKTEQEKEVVEIIGDSFQMLGAKESEQKEAQQKSDEFFNDEITF